ncbi:TadE/TadG family type IV pilus assembly protein [Streptomyces sp. NPDC002990]
MILRIPRRVRGRVADDRGISTLEVVIIAPVFFLFILVLAAFGQLVQGRGAVDGAARDAARAGSIQKNQDRAMAEANKAAQAGLSDVCAGPVTVQKTSAGFEPGGFFTVEVSCEIRGLAMLGIDVPTRISGTSTSSLDPFRRAA